MTKLTLLALATSLLFQAGSARELLSLQRPLTAAEITRVASGVRQALAGKTLRLVVDKWRGEPEILIGRDGLPRMVRFKGLGERIASISTPTGSMRVFNLADVIVSVFEYSRVPTNRCGGGPKASGMVIEYVRNLTMNVRHVTAREPGRRDESIARPFEMLHAPETLISGDSRIVGTRQTRALMSPFPMPDMTVLTGDPAPNPAEFIPVQSLWIDTASLLPLRYEVHQRQALVGATDLVYEQIDLQRPAGFVMPTCIP